MMPQLLGLDIEISGVVRVGLHDEGHPLVSSESEGLVGLDRVAATILEDIRPDLVGESDTPPGNTISTLPSTNRVSR